MSLRSQPWADLLAALHNPETLSRLEPTHWEALLNHAETLRLASRIAWDAERIGFLPNGWLGDRLVGLRLRGEGSDRAIRWEFDRVREALRNTETTVVALKGAAYILLDLPFARGRRVADIDILVPEADLSRVESALLASGWEKPPLDPYDDRYYRLWTHELPPLVHKNRLIPIDVHHGLVPRTSRIQPDPRRVIAQSCALADGRGSVPSPIHLVVQAAVHLFHDGEIAGAFRDLVDLDGLFRHFSSQPTFWSSLPAETEAMGASRAMFYALRYSRRLLATPVPAEVLRLTERWAPPHIVLSLMDHLVERTLIAGEDRKRSIAAIALRSRGHWLRMPPTLLVRHLTIKSYRRWRLAVSGGPSHAEQVRKNDG